MANLNITPRPTDILFGKGTASINNVGNVAMRKLVGCSLKEYALIPKSKRAKKNRFIRDLVDVIKSSGGRFLRKPTDDGSWKEVTDEEARGKLGQELRDTMRNPNKQKKVSLKKLAGIAPHYKSVEEFDWRGIVQACLLVDLLDDEGFENETDKSKTNNQDRSTIKDEGPLDLEDGLTLQWFQSITHDGSIPLTSRPSSPSTLSINSVLSLRALSEFSFGC